MNDSNFLEEAIDYALRLLSVHGNRKLCKDQALFEQWINCCSQLAQSVIKNCFK
jgi:hypothetical protein